MGGHSRVAGYIYGICTNEEYTDENGHTGVCPCCASKEKIRVMGSHDFVCPTCKEPLHKVEAPKTFMQKYGIMVYSGIAVVVIAAIVGAVFAFGGGSSKSDDTKAETAFSSHNEAEETHNEAEETHNEAEETHHEAEEAGTSTNDELELAKAQAEAEKAKAEAEKAKAEAEKAKAQAKTGSSGGSKAKGSGTLRLSYGTYVGATRNGYPHGQGRLTYSRSRQINRNDAKGRMANPGDQVVGEFYNGYFINGKHLDSDGNILESVMIGVGDESSYDSK